MSKKKDDLYIRVLKYADGLEKFHLRDLISSLTLNQEEEDIIIHQIWNRGIFGSYSNLEAMDSEVVKDKDIFMTVEDKFRLLEYVELQDARESSLRAQESSKKAYIVAIVALSISFLGFIVSTVFTCLEYWGGE